MTRTLRAALASVVVTSPVVIAAGCGAADGVVDPDPVEAGCGAIYYGGLGVEPPPDGPTLCAPGRCNYQTQEGCGAGETCTPVLDADAARAEPACVRAGGRPRGAPCDATATDPAERCERGHYCLDGICRRQCCGEDYSACDPGESCIRQVRARFSDAGPSEDIGMHLCFPVGTCDVLAPGDCASEQRTCRIVDPTGAVACAPYSDLPVDAPCSEARQCGAGLHCVDGACRRLCAWPPCGGPGCPGREGVCVHFDRDPPGVGECTPDWDGPPLAGDAGGLPFDASVLR